jgi:transposase
MKHPTPEQKHSILTHDTSRHKGETLQQILALHAVTASRKTVAEWQKRWDGTLASLQPQHITGRPHVLNRAEVQRYIATPIRRANRSAKPVRYTKVAEQVREKTGKAVSDRTVQRVGKQELGGRKTRGKKRTAEESESTDTCMRANACGCVCCAC